MGATYKEGRMDTQYLDAFTEAYLACALWSSTDESDEGGGYPLDHDTPERDAFTVDDFTAQARLDAAEACQEFVEHHGEDLQASDLTPEQAGHDFWLSRNGHGAGYWDRGLGPVGDRLTEAAKAYGESYVMVSGTDGLEIH